MLAGGAARRMGGAKAIAPLAGRPLLAWTLDALRAAGLGELAVVAKRDTALPEDVGAPVWVEPDEPRHPLTGVREALARAGAREVLTVPVDLPLVPASVLAELATVALGERSAATVRAGGRLQPLVARFAPAARARLAADGRATDAVLALDPIVLEVAVEGLVNLNTPEDLRAAEAAVRDRARAG